MDARVDGVKDDLPTHIASSFECTGDAWGRGRPSLHSPYHDQLGSACSTTCPNTMPIRTPVVDGAVHAPAKRDTSRQAIEILQSLSLEEKVFFLSGSSFTRTSGLAQHLLGRAKVSDGPTDIRGDGVFNAPDSIVIPNATCLASTWDLELIEEIGATLAHEAKIKSVDVLLAPTLNLHRDPRGGRNQESYSEDPVLAGKAGAAFARGGVAVCLKHLVCNDSETQRRFYDVRVDERTLREVYMRPFEIAVKEANPQSIMTAYNKINGTSASENAHLMSIVRDEWKWDGLFMSDWFGTYNGVKSVRAGLDLEMPFPAARGQQLLAAVRAGEVHETELDGPVLRMIRFLSSLKPPAAHPTDKPSPRRPSDIALNRRAAAEGSVLLQNDGILPLSPSGSKRRLAVIGALATDRVLTQLICPSYIISPLKGIQAQYEGSIIHAHGVQIHKVVPKLDGRFSEDIKFHKWNKGDRLAGKRPILTDTYAEALEAMFMRRIPGLDDTFEIEMDAKVTVGQGGVYTLSLISAHTAEVFINEQLVFKYDPGTVVDIQKFLFHSHEVAQTFEYTFDTATTYDIRVVAESQPQSGSEPVAQGMIFGMVRRVTRLEAIEEAVTAAQASDAAVLFVGTTSEWEMEGVDRADIKLPCNQDELIKAVLDANPNTIIVNQSGSAVDLREARRARAVIHAHFAGQESGNAIADVLFGRVNPAGRTTYSFPMDITEIPSYINFPCKQDLSIDYVEGCKNGYRAGYQCLYPFGYGLSYTSFEYSDVHIQQSGQNGDVACSITVTNTGAVPGREVIQAYVGEVGEQRLESFAKTGTLAPGKSAMVQMVLRKRAFADWDTDRSGWSVRNGLFKLHIARSATDVISTLEHEIDEALFWRGM